MKNRFKIILLVSLVIILTFLVFKQSLRFFNKMGDVELPTQQSRNLSELGIYNIMTVEELATKFNVDEEKIYNLLEINQDDEDSFLTLKELRKKYNKTPKEFKDKLELLVQEDSEEGDYSE